MSRIIHSDHLQQELDKMGFRPSFRTFAIEVRGDSMAGRHILEGDIVILEHGIRPKHGDVVATYIDNRSILKTFFVCNGKPFLKSENPSSPDWIAAQDLVLQGVGVALVRMLK